jgi:chromosome segregation protein
MATQLQAAEAAYAQRLADAELAETEIERTRAELLSHTAVTERLMEISRQLESTLERLSVQAEGLAREGKRASAVHAERKSEADKLGAEISAAREHLAKLLSEREAAVHAVVQGHEVVSDTDAEHTRIRDEHSRIRHRLDTLKELDERRAHFSPAVQRLFSPTGAPDDIRFMGTLVDKLNVAPQWEKLVEGVFGSALQSVIVPTPNDAVRAAEWLRSTDAGRASFLVVGLHGASDDLKEVAYEVETKASETHTFTAEIGSPVGSWSTPGTNTRPRQAPDCSRSNARFASSKRRPPSTTMRCHERLRLWQALEVAWRSLKTPLYC